MILTLLILIPLLAGCFSFVMKGNGAKGIALVSGLATLVLSGYISYESLDGYLSWAVK